MTDPVSRPLLQLDGDRGEGGRHSILPLRVPPILGYLAAPAIALAAVAIGWELWTRLADVPVYMLPAPTRVAGRLFGDFGYFIGNGATTLLHATAGFALGTTVAISAATLMARSPLLERTLFPMAVLVKVIPVVAVAPLFLIWFGFGSLPIILIAALITFFPVLVNGLTGLRSVNPGAMDLFRSVRASEREIFLKLRLPSALPYLFAAFRITIPLSVIGAFVGELFIGSRGIGKVIFVAYNNIDMPTLFAAILVMAFIGVSLTILTSYFERRFLFWHESLITP